MNNLPKNYTEYKESDDLMSSFDRAINKDIADAIMDKPFFSRYAGWDFNGKVWGVEGVWYCDVWAYGVCRETVRADTLEKIMEDVSDKYGWD